MAGPSPMPPAPPTGPSPSTPIPSPMDPIPCPVESLTLADRVWGPLERELVLREKDQLEVPEALAKAPPSTETWTEVIARPSEVTPETVVVPETVEPFAGLLIDTERAAAVTTLMLRLV